MLNSVSFALSCCVLCVLCVQMVRTAKVSVSRRFLDFTAHQDLQLSAGLDLDWPRAARSAVGGARSSSRVKAVRTRLYCAGCNSHLGTALDQLGGNSLAPCVSHRDYFMF